MPDEVPPSRIDVANLRLNGELGTRDNDLHPHGGDHGQMQVDRAKVSAAITTTRRWNSSGTATARSPTRTFQGGVSLANL